jgi:hypothetical protein
MGQKQQNQVWLVLIVAILSTAGVICVAIIVLGTPFAKRLADQYFSPDETTGLVLNFEGSLAGAAGEPGYTEGVPFVSGHRGQAVLFNAENTLSYFAEGNISPAQGEIEFWLQPLWNGDDHQSYVFFEIGADWFNRLRITKDGANNFRFMVWSAETEYDVACNVSAWIATEWHHVKVIWQPERISLYLDDELCETETAVVLPESLTNRLYIGSSAQQDLQAQAVIDEFIIRE